MKQNTSLFEDTNRVTSSEIEISKISTGENSTCSR